MVFSGDKLKQGLQTLIISKGLYRRRYAVIFLSMVTEIKAVAQHLFKGWTIGYARVTRGRGGGGGLGGGDAGQWMNILVAREGWGGDGTSKTALRDSETARGRRGGH